jgi:hypothetical protein
VTRVFRECGISGCEPGGESPSARSRIAQEIAGFKIQKDAKKKILGVFA